MRWHARTEQLIGPEGCGALARATVAIFGLGGVGSYACEALARAGVGHLRLVDYDVVNPTNLNRQLLATRSTLGAPKAEVAARRVLDINPRCAVDARRVFIHEDTLPDLLAEPLDVLIDAIDSVNCKVNLLLAATDRGLTVVSSMGAGGRLDGGQIQVGDISESRNCPLARIIRQRIHRRGLFTGVRCVYSVETSRNTLPHNPVDLDRHQGPGRARAPLGTISYMPALFGLRAAEETIRLLLARDGALAHHLSDTT